MGEIVFIHSIQMMALGISLVWMVVARLMSASMFGIVWCTAADGCLDSTGHGAVNPLVGHMSNKEQRHRFELGRAAGDVPVFTTHQY